MEKLKQIIVSTLVNNLDTVPVLSSLEMESVATCSAYIAQEIKDVAIEFAKWIANTKKHGFCKQLYEAMIVNKCSTVEELFNQFINDKYKDS